MDQPTVIVTGASRGLGAAAARQLGQRSANVVLMARSQEPLKMVAKECEQLGGKALAIAGDVSRADDCDQVIQEGVEWFGHIDGLVNNSGVIEPIGMISDTPASLWQLNWAINVLGPVMLIQKALPYLRPRNGRIINITSGAAESAIGGWGAYSAAKAAINKITQVLASEEPAISVIALKPGIVDTDMQATIREKGRGHMAEQNYRWLSGLYEQKRMVPPEKPGLAIACLALAMPHEWSGEIIQWDEERVQRLTGAQEGR